MTSKPEFDCACCEVTNRGLPTCKEMLARKKPNDCLTGECGCKEAVRL